MRAAFFAVLFVLTHTIAVRAAEDQISVRVVGTLATGIVAIGSETTGITITAKGITWELELGDQQTLRARAEQLDGEKVLVEGTLERRQGVEVKERWLVTVTRLEKPAARPRNQSEGAQGQGAIELREHSDDAAIAIHREDSMARIDIRCELGTGRATVARRADHWPAHVRVRLHLDHLEAFRATSGETAVEWAAASAGHDGQVVVIQPESERAIDAGSPYWTPICIVGREDAPNDNAPFFEIPLPTKLFEGNPAELRLTWANYVSE